MKSTPIAITVDHRGGIEFGPGASRVLELLQVFRRVSPDVRLLNINESLGDLRRAIGAAVVFVAADTFAPGSEGARRFPAPHALRRWLEDEGVCFVGATFAGVRRASTGDKIVARAALARKGLTVPRGVALRHGSRFSPERAGRLLGWPLVVKRAVGAGGSAGVHLARSPAELQDCVTWEWRRSGGDVVVEEHVLGREFTVWVRDRGGRPTTYATVEICKPPDMPLFDQGAKVRCRVVRRPPSAAIRRPTAILAPELGRALGARVGGAARAAHRACGLRHYSRIDMIAAGKRVWVLDVNAAPHMGAENLGRVAVSRGDSLASFLASLIAEASRQHALAGARNRRR